MAGYATDARGQAYRDPVARPRRVRARQQLHLPDVSGGGARRVLHGSPGRHRAPGRDPPRRDRLPLGARPHGRPRRRRARARVDRDVERDDRRAHPLGRRRPRRRRGARASSSTPMPAGRRPSRGRTSLEGRSRRGCDAPRPLGRRAPRAARGRRDRDLDDRPRRGGRDRRGRPAPVGARPWPAQHPAPRPRSRGGDLLRARGKRAPVAGRRRLRGRGRRLHRPPGRRGGPHAQGRAGRPRRAVVRHAPSTSRPATTPTQAGRGRVRRSSPPTAPATCSRSTPRPGRSRGPHLGRGSQMS